MKCLISDFKWTGVQIEISGCKKNDFVEEILSIISLCVNFSLIVPFNEIGILSKKKSVFKYLPTLVHDTLKQILSPVVVKENQ